MLIIKNQSQYGSIVANSKKPLLVDFYADWCGPCKALTPKLEELEKKYTNISFLKINVDNEDCSKICNLYEIESLPTVIFIVDKVEDSDKRVIGNDIDIIENNLKKVDKIKT